jgi:hypothetical protein
MKLKPIKRDKAAINDGQWVADVPALQGVKLKVRGKTTDLFSAAVDKHLRATPRDQRDRVGEPNKQARILAVALAVHETILLDWDGIEDEKGKVIKFSTAQAKEWLTNPDFEHFLDGVLWAAQVVDNQVLESEGELVKNS